MALTSAEIIKGMFFPPMLLSAKPDPVVISFAFFGCNRMDKKDWEGQKDTNPSSANVPQLRQNFTDIANLRVVPSLVFCGGDIVMNYADDRGEVLRAQLDAWAIEAKSSPLFKKTTIVPMPGNHETNRKVGEDKITNPATVAVWDSWFNAEGFAKLATNAASAEKSLNYSFDRAGVHFLVLNSDTVGAANKIARIPLEWAQKDVKAANENPKVRAIFVLAHRNLIDPITAAGDAPIDVVDAKPFLVTLQHARKVRAFVCAHVHAFDITPLGGSSRARQVILGNGGSKLEKLWQPKRGTFFGFGVFDVYRSGRVVLRNYKRPVPKNYFSADTVPATSETVVLFNPKK